MRLSQGRVGGRKGFGDINRGQTAVGKNAVFQRLQSLMEGAGFQRGRVGERVGIDQLDAFGDIQRFQRRTACKRVAADGFECRGQGNACELLTAGKQVGRQRGHAVGDHNGLDRCFLEQTVDECGRAFRKVNGFQACAFVERIETLRDRSRQSDLRDRRSLKGIVAEVCHIAAEGDACQS